MGQSQESPVQSIDCEEVLFSNPEELSGGPVDHYNN